MIATEKKINSLHLSRLHISQVPQSKEPIDVYTLSNGRRKLAQLRCCLDDHLWVVFIHALDKLRSCITRGICYTHFASNLKLRLRLRCSVSEAANNRRGITSVFYRRGCGFRGWRLVPPHQKVRRRWVRTKHPARIPSSRSCRDEGRLIAYRTYIEQVRVWLMTLRV